MSGLQEEYKLAIDNKMLSPKVSEQDFEKMLKDETKRKEYWDYCNKKNPSFYADSYDHFSMKVDEMLGVNANADNQDAERTQEESDARIKELQSQGFIRQTSLDEGNGFREVSTPTSSTWRNAPEKTNKPTLRMYNPPTTGNEFKMNAEPSQSAGFTRVESKETNTPTTKNVFYMDGKKVRVKEPDYYPSIKSNNILEVDSDNYTILDAMEDAGEWLGNNSVVNEASEILGAAGKGLASGVVDAVRGIASFAMQVIESGIKVDATGQVTIPLTINHKGEVEMGEIRGISVDEQRAQGTWLASAEQNLKKLSDKIYEDALSDIAENEGFIDLISDGKYLDALKLSIASTSRSVPYMAASMIPGGGFLMGTLDQANRYVDSAQEHPDMNNAERLAYAIGGATIEQLIEKYTNPFKGLKGATKAEVKRTLKEIEASAEKAVWKRVTGNIAKETVSEGAEELATSALTDLFGTMIDLEGEHGISIHGQYKQYAEQMRAKNPNMTDEEIRNSFVKIKTKEYSDALILGSLGGAYISTTSTLATTNYAKADKEDSKLTLNALDATASESGTSKEDVLDIVMREQKGNEMNEEENQIIKSFKTNYAKATMKSAVKKQADEFVSNMRNKTDDHVYEISFADGSLEEGDVAYIVDGNVSTTEVDGKNIFDTANSDKVVHVRIFKADGSEQIKQVAVDELDIVNTPVSSKDFASQLQDQMYNTAEQLFIASQSTGADNNQAPLRAEGEQTSNIEGRQFTNGQQTITASNLDSNGNVKLSAPVTLPNGEVVTELPQAAFDALMEVDGWQEVTSQPQGQVQEQPQAATPIVWSEMDADQATATVVERNKGDKTRAKKFAEAQVKVKEKALKEAQKELDQVAESGDVDAFNAAQDKVDAAQAEVDKWTAVANGIDAYNAPVQPSGNISATSASGNGVVTEEPAQAPEVQEPASQDPQQPTQGAQDEPKKITRESVRELLSKEAQEMEEAWNHNEEMDETDATELAHDIFGVLGDNVHSMMREEIDDYVGEHYPTQATISGETDSEKGKKEREQLKNDKNLKALEDAVKAKQAELDAIVEGTRKMIKEICTSPDVTAQDIAELLEALAGYESRIFHLHEQSGSMSNYDMLDKYIGTTKAFQKDVKMLYGRKIAMANASVKVKEVIELADKASEVVGDKEKFAEAYKRKEDALNALTLEELEELKDVLRITGMNDFLYQDAENRVAAIKEEQRRQKQANSLSDIFDNGGTQVERPTKVKPYKYNPFDFATNDPARPVMGTAYHEDGYVVSTDAYVLVAVKQEYDKELEGKMTDKGGKVVLEGSKFPKWKQVFDGVKTNKTDVTAVSVDDFRSFLEGAKATLKAEWQSKKDNGEKVGSFKDYLYNKADVMIRTNGGVHAYRLGRLIDFANALSEIGAKEVFFNGRQEASAQPIVAETSQGKAIIMPVLVDNISIEEGGRVVTGNSNTAFLYDLADKNTRMSANNSQNTLQNGNNSVPLQGEKSATQKVIDKIDSKHFPVVVFNKKNYREVMRKAGASEKLIKEVGDVLSDLKPHQVMGGLFDEGMIFIQEQTDLDEVRKAYIHERQHAFNATNEQLLLKMASTSYKSQFASMIRAMAGNNFYDKYGMKYLVDEFICRAMEIAYSVDTDAELEAELRKIGANDKQIQIIKEINNEQRNDNSLSNARYNSLLNSNDSSRSEQVRRDSQSVSRGVLGEKGNGSAQIGERRDRSRRSSETIGETAKGVAAEQTLSNAGEQVSADGVRYNIASNDKVVAARETQLKRSVRNGLLTANEANEIREFAQAMRVIAETIAQAKKADGSAEFPSFSEWNGLEVQVNANGTPLVSAIKSNGEYPMNIDFAKHCIKRDSTNQVLNKLVQVDPELFTSLTTDMLVEINQIINKHGLSVPCVGCFVEARRFRSAEYAKSVVNTWNTLVDAVKKGDKAVKEAKKKLGGKQSVDKIVEHLRNTPSDDVKISESDIISPNKYGELMMKHPSIPTLLQATQGQNNTHLIVPEAIYYGDVLNLSAENSWDVDAAYEVGGVRLQSFSDFKAKLFFDYCQVLADLASKKLPAHSYTKVPSFAELFGLTGMKINLSLYYSGTGLDANGNYTYSDESISPEFAFDLQSREGYTDNVGTMAIGVSDEHIWKLLKDENIRSISPYHKSGINPEVAAKLKADEFVDYTNEQNAVTPKSAKKEGESWQDYYARITKRVDGKVPTIGKKVKPEFNLYDDLIDTNSPIQTAQNYVAYCQENGIVPKFASFVYNADGSFNEEYYKLLFDFSVYNKDGVYAPQGAVKWAEGSMPTNTVDILKQALEVEEGTIAKNQAEVDEVVKDILANVFDRDDLAASESQVRYSVVTDKKKIEELEASEKMKGYRTVILNEDGTFSSPMATGLGNKGKTSARTSGFELGKWEKAEERPELADENGKINLKPKKGGDTYVDYNPYIHNRLDKINTQFTSAWRKPFLVYIETEIPMSDIESGYHAEKAALSVGVHPWNGGDLVLSRYDKPVRIVPWEEVADAWAEQFDEVTFDIVNPELLPLLHERGVKILPPKKAAKEKALAAYEQWKAENSKPRFSISNIAEDAWNKYQYDGELESIRDVIDYVEENMPENDQTKSLFDAIETYKEEEFEDRQYYGMRGDLEPFADAILEELETLMNSNPRFSITAEEDKAYADAVARGDMETAQDMLRDAAERAGYAPLGDYKDSHQAPSATVEKEDFTNIEALQEQIDNGNVDSNLFAVAQGVTAAPQDYFSPQGARWYGYGNLSGMESYSALNNAIRSINAQLREYGEVREMPKVKVYRAVPKNIKGAQLESEGQWVSPSREYAVGHGRHRFGFNQYRIIEQEVPADQLWWDANDIREWGFDDGTVNAYQNTKNNRKLYEVTYDDNGELIPLSKRFDKRKANVRFSVTAQEDAAYMDAVDRGDMETAQRMVNEAAKNAGYTIRAYHGTDKGGFTVFDPSYSDDGISLFTSADRRIAGSYTKSHDDIYLGEYVGNIKDAISLIQDNSNYEVNKLYTVDGNEFYNSIEELNEYWDLEEGEEIKEVYEITDGYYYFLRPEDMGDENEVIKIARTFIKEIAEDGVQSGIYPLFLKFNNPMRIDANGSNWNEIYEENAKLVELDYVEEDGAFILRSKVYDTPYASIDSKEGREEFGSYEEMENYVVDTYGDYAASMLEDGFSGVVDLDYADSAYSMTTREIAEDAKEGGHDGVIIENVWDNGGYAERQGLEGTVYISFNPNQIKSADPVTYDDNGNVIPLSERFNDDKKDIRFSLSNNNQRIFVSNAERAVESIKQEKATPQQWKAMIEKQGGLKAGEDKWLGLSEWLDSKVAPAQENETMGEVARRVAKNTITKQEILDYIAEHQIQIEEVAYMDADDVADIDLTPEQQEKYDQFVDEYMTIQEEDGLSEEEAFEELVDRYGEDFTMAFFVDSEGELQIQGDYNGRTADAALYYLGGEQVNVINRTRLGYTTKGLKNNREIALTVPTIESWNRNDTIHFGDAGDGRTIAWIRFGETNAPVKEYADFYEYQKKLQKKYFPERTIQSLSGEDLGVLIAEERNEFDRLKAAKERIPYKESRTNRVLVIDEIQSKRHQEGREKGYKEDESARIDAWSKASRERIELGDKWQREHEGFTSEEWYEFVDSKEYQDALKKVRNAEEEMRKNTGSTIPSAPFDKNWHELAFKRMLRYAAENGYDYVAWTTGEQQAERYDLGKQFDSIEREDNPSINGRRFALYGANYFTFVVNDEGIVTESDMSEIKGKPLADVVGKDLAIRMMSLEDGDAIEGADLRIGGEGMKGFYDKMLPSFVAKYTKKWGAKVQDINLPSLEESAQTMHAVNVTPEMKESVMEGQPMFSITNRTENLHMSQESVNFANDYRWGDTMRDAYNIDRAKFAEELELFEDAQLSIDLAGVVNGKRLTSKSVGFFDQKAYALSQFFNKIADSKDKPVVIPTHVDIKDYLVEAGISEEIADAFQQEAKDIIKDGDIVKGLHYNGTIVVVGEFINSLADAKSTYAHELQHKENKRNADAVVNTIKVSTPHELLNFVDTLQGKGLYAHLLQLGADGFRALADEVIAYGVQYGYRLGENGNLAEALRESGLTNEKLINIITQEYERQKESHGNLIQNNRKGNSRFYNRNNPRYNRANAAVVQGESKQVERTNGYGLVQGSEGTRQGVVANAKALQELRNEAIRLAKENLLQVEPMRESGVRFSITSAPTPSPEETKSEYLKRYMEWRENQVNEIAVNAYKGELKKGTKFWRTFVKKIVDRNIAIEKFQDFVLKISKSLDLEGKISINTNAFLDVSMAAGRAHSANERFKTRYQTPMMDAIKAIVKSKKLDHIDIRWNGIDGKKNGKRLTASELVGIYCQAKDVQEAIEMGLPDRGQQGFKDNLLMDGNEVSHEDVIRIVEDALDGTNLKDNLWKAINQATLFSLVYQRRHRFISRKTFDEYKFRKYYVPERGWRERDLEDRERKYVDDRGNEGRMDSPFNVALKKAKGRSSLASDPFAYIVSIAESTIAAVEKNRVKQKFLQFLFDNEQVGLKTKAWTIKQVYLVKVKNKDGEEIGTVATYEKPSNPDDIAGKVGNDLESLKKLAKNQKNQHAVVVVKDGEEYVIWLEDEQLANAINRNYAGVKFQNSMLGRGLKGATGYYSGQLTQYNPEFAVSNFVRDYLLSQISNLAVQDKPGRHFIRFNYNLAKIMPELVTYVGAHTIGREAFLNTKKGKYMQEYFALGAQTGFSYLEDVSVLRDVVDKMVNKNNIVKYATAVPKFVFMDMLSALTELSELSIRMTQYITCREMGMSAKEAAIEAKEITVNFDRKGELAGVFGCLWSFFNASVQGTNKIVRDIKRKPVRATITYGAFAGLLFYLGYLLTNLFPDDPEEEEFWNEYVRRTNITVGEYKIPMAHFFRIFWGGGVTMALKEQGRLTETQAAGEMTRMVFDEIIPQSPFQIQNLFEYNEEADSYDISLEGYERGLIPSVLSPIYDIKQNKDFLGREISKEPYIKSEEGKYKAKKYERAESTNKKYIEVADWLSGGDPKVLTKGVDDGNPIDINGTELQYIVEGYTKQFATLVDTYNLVTKAIKEEEIQTKDIPFLRKFKKDYMNESAYKQEYWTLFNYMDQYKAQRKEVGEDANPSKEEFYKNIESSKLLKNKPKGGETPQEVKELMDLNKQWRKLLDKD